MIYCVWYPSGGFGHFINAILTLHGTNFVRPKNKKLMFGTNGNSHNLDLVAPKYFHDPNEYNFKFDENKIYSVLVDNGINNESMLFQNVFLNASIIKICYSDQTWPIVFRTMVEKAMAVEFDSEITLGTNWEVTDNWAIREKYFLLLRDHPIRHQWKPNTACLNLFVDDLLDYRSLFDKLRSFEISIDNFKDDWIQWWQANLKFIDPATTGIKVIQSVKNKQLMDLSSITDLWTQAIVYYYIWLEFSFEVPHNDYSEWFTNTDQIVKMLSKHGVNIDSH